VSGPSHPPALAGCTRNAAGSDYGAPSADVGQIVFMPNAPSAVAWRAPFAGSDRRRPEAIMGQSLDRCRGIERVSQEQHRIF